MCGWGAAMEEAFNKFDGITRDTNATIKAILYEIEDASTLPPDVAAHPYQLEKRRKIVVRRIWDLVKKCMSLVEQVEAGR